MFNFKHLKKVANEEMDEAAKVMAKKRKREEEFALAKKQGLEAAKKKNAENMKLIYNKSKQYIKEYAEMDNELIQLKCEARLKGGFYVEPKSKLLFIIRINVTMPLTQRQRKFCNSCV